MSERDDRICGNVMLSTLEMEGRQPLAARRLEDIIAELGDMTGTISLPIASTRPVSLSPEEILKGLFGVWPETGTEEEDLQEIYRSRLVPSVKPDEE